MRKIILWIDDELPHVHQLLTVHDSVILECPNERVTDTIKALVKMPGRFDFDPPQKFDIKFGPNWGEMEKVK